MILECKGRTFKGETVEQIAVKAAKKIYFGAKHTVVILASNSGVGYYSCEATYEKSGDVQRVKFSLSRPTTETNEGIDQ